jgi:hypothetical protein
MAPGTAAAGASCDDETRCAENLVCSRASNAQTGKCLRLCRVGIDTCNGGVCQGGSKELPENIGICVGELPDGG